jgi:rRNA maturation RNase YbeY
MNSKIQVINYELVSTDLDFKGIEKSMLSKSLEKHLPEIRQSINVVFITPEEIKKLNLEFRHKNEITDVLSFETESIEEIAEIYICAEYILDRIKRSSKCTVGVVNSSLFLTDVLRMIVHGYLHINGYDHEGYFEGSYSINSFEDLQTKDTMDIEQMFVEQEKILSSILDDIKSQI